MEGTTDTQALFDLLKGDDDKLSDNSATMLKKALAANGVPSTNDIHAKITEQVTAGMDATAFGAFVTDQFGGVSKVLLSLAMDKISANVAAQKSGGGAKVGRVAVSDHQ